MTAERTNRFERSCEVEKVNVEGLRGGNIGGADGWKILVSAAGLLFEVVESLPRQCVTSRDRRVKR